MLELLDVAIGFATVMLAVSLVIMTLTQAISSSLALRGTKLRTGLWHLIEQTAPSISLHAAEISREIVAHRLVSDTATVLPGRWRWASVIKKEELMPVLDAVLKSRQITIDDLNERAAIEQWFDSFMTRVSQWFAMNTRWITVALAVVLSFTMHIDSVQVLQQLTEDTETRAKVLAMSASLLDQSPASVGSVEVRYSDALKDVVGNNAAKFTDGTDASALPTITTRSEASDWIGTHVRLRADKDVLVTQYNDAVDSKLTEAIDRAIDRAKTLQGDLTSAGISFPPPGHTPADWLALTSPHFWGMAASVLFLSLGAPFWFNLLKNMTSLKSAVAIRKPGDANGDVPEEGMVAGPPSVHAPRLPAIPQPTDLERAAANSGRSAESRTRPPRP
jgi:hypothetical protein